MVDLARDSARLRIGIDVIPDESLPSFVFRLSKRLGSLSPATIGKRCGMTSWTTKPHPEALARLAEFANVDPGALSALTSGSPGERRGRYRGRRLPIRMFRFGNRNALRFICPECLAEASYHRAIWDFVAVSACPRHGAELVAACDACGNNLGWNGKDLAMCRCGRQLSRIQAQRIPSTDLIGAEVFYGLLGEDGFSAQAERARLLAPFGDLDDAEIVDFLYRFGTEFLGNRPRFFAYQGVPEHAHLGHLALARGLAALDPWPDAFLEAIAGFCLRSGAIDSTAFAKWGAPIYRWVDALLPGHGVEIEDALDQFRSRFDMAEFLARRPNGPRPRPRRTIK